MTAVLDGPVLGTVGCGKLASDMDCCGRVVCTTLNVAGWVPGISIFSGAVRGIAGMRFLAKRGKGQHILGKAWIARGVTEMCCVGFLWTPADIACSAVRSVKNKK